MQAVKDGRQATHRLAPETHFEKFISAGNARRAEARNEHKTHHENAEQGANLEHQKRHVVAIDVCRRTQKRRRAHGCRDEADAHGHPRHRAAAEHVFLEVLVSARNPQAYRKREEQVTE